jgi:hypothetical protein
MMTNTFHLMFLYTGIFTAILTLAGIIHHTNGLSTLLLGDSVDRFMMEDWCNTNGFSIVPFGDFTPVQLKDIIKYGHQYKIMLKGRWNHPFICFDDVTNDSIASVHIFGSADQGPYLYNISNNPLTDKVNTPIRLELSLKWYIEQFGYPDRVFWHSGQWDKQRYYEYHNCAGIMPWSATWNNSLQQFYTQTNHRIDQILQVIGSRSSFGLRTAVWQKDKCEMGFLDEVNDILRRISVERKLVLYDYDKDVWSVTNYDRSQNNIQFLYRDWMHPTRFVSYNAAEKLIGRRHTNFMFNYSTSNAITASIISELSPYDGIEVGIFKIPETNAYYFSKYVGRNYSERSLWKINGKRLYDLYFGPGDVLEISYEAKISLFKGSSSVASIPNFFYHFSGHEMNTFAVVTTHDEKYLIDGTRSAYNASSCDMKSFTSLEFNYPDMAVYSAVPYFWIHRFIHRREDLPGYLCQEGKLLRCAKSKQIFLVENYTKHAVTSLNAFTAKGLDLEQVQAIPVGFCRFMHYIPNGDPLV